jgi:hypothetical protein
MVRIGQREIGEGDDHAVATSEKAGQAEHESLVVDHAAFHENGCQKENVKK